MKRAYIDLSEGQMHLRRVEGGGIVIVLLHRTPSSSLCFENVLAQLEGRRSAIAFDTPGFGQSFRPAGRPLAVDYARWFLAALDDPLATMLERLKIERPDIPVEHLGLAGFGGEVPAGAMVLNALRASAVVVGPRRAAAV